MGFSAGGTVTGSVAQTYDALSKPDFVAPIYAYVPAMLGDKVPADAPPMFLALATDDPIANANTRLYEKWRDAGKSVEMHVYARGGHGFGIQKREQPTDDWTVRFENWLSVLGLLEKK
jgi:acetyl esterase/lipase